MVQGFIILLLALNEFLHLLLILEHQNTVALLVLLDLWLQRFFLRVLGGDHILGWLLAQHLELLLELRGSHLVVLHVLEGLRLGGFEVLGRFWLEGVVSEDLPVEFGCLVEVVLDGDLVAFNHFDILLDFWVPCYHGIDANL